MHIHDQDGKLWHKAFRVNTVADVKFGKPVESDKYVLNMKFHLPT
jgi:hypothetical protein